MKLGTGNRLSDSQVRAKLVGRAGGKRGGDKGKRSLVIEPPSVAPAAAAGRTTVRDRAVITTGRGTEDGPLHSRSSQKGVRVPRNLYDQPVIK